MDSSGIPAHLCTRFLGRKIVYMHETGSTNDEAKALARSSHLYPEGTVVLAERQTKGRGRLDRSWHSPPGGIYMSVILRPAIAPEEVPGLSLVAGYAVALTLRKDLGLPARIKWPNDVHIDGRKSAGILSEMSVGTEHLDRPEVSYVVLGIGINANVNTKDLPAEIREMTASLKEELGHELDPNLLTASVLNNLEPAYEDFAGKGLERILPELSSLLAYVNEPVILKSRTPGDLQKITGIFLGVDKEGRAVIEVGNEKRPYSAGDLSLRRRDSEHQTT